jgi:hypothetical protein
MAVKHISTIKPTHYKTDKKGNKIAVFRGGIRHTNKYDKKTPKEIERDENMGNEDYNPVEKSTP